MPAGRKTKYTPETVAKVLQAIRLGATYTLACNYASISLAVFEDWMRDKSDFSESVKAAEGAGAVGWLAKIEQAANEGSWQAAAWKLERKYPKDYGRVVRVDLEGDLRRLAAELGLDADDAVAEAERLVGSRPA